MKIVYITGCLGFIGSYVTRACLQLGWKVYGIDKCTYAANTSLLDEFNKYENFYFEKIDINDLTEIKQCDYFINIAAESHVGNSIIDSTDFINSNIVGVKNILDLLRYMQESSRPIFFHFSTDEVYGDITEGTHSEVDLLKPSNPYSASKASADMLILAWARTYGIRYLILRPTNNYGIGQHPEKLIPLSIKKLFDSEKIQLHDNGLPVRTWLHVEDTAKAVLHIIESGKFNEIYNVSGGFEQTNFETVKNIINNFYNQKFDDINKFLDLSYNRQGQDIRYSLDDNKLRNLGWIPDKNFCDEIKQIVVAGREKLTNDKRN